MAVREWRVESASLHIVRLEHGYWSGQAIIWLDGFEIYRREFSLMDFGLVHRFDVEGAAFSVHVICRMLCYYDYQLWIDNIQVKPS